jgi:hypothetical protein
MIESPVAVTFELLLASIAKLEHSDKHKLWEYLDAELFEEDDNDKLHAEAIASIQASYADYEAGDYLTIQEYRAQRVRKSA